MADASIRVFLLSPMVTFTSGMARPFVWISASRMKMADCAISDSERNTQSEQGERRIRRSHQARHPLARRFDWGDRLFYASDYFERLYEYAVQLIKDSKAYVDSLTADEIRESPWNADSRARKAESIPVQNHRRKPGSLRKDARR